MHASQHPRAWVFSIAASLVALLALVAAWTWHRSAERAEGVRRELTVRMQQIESGRGRTTREIEALEKSRHKLEAKSGPQPARAVSVSAMLQTRTVPEVQAARATLRKEELAISYGPLFRRLRLSKDDISTLLAAMVEVEITELDLRDIRNAENARAVSALRKEAGSRLAAIEGAVLGEAGMAELKDYERSLPARDLVTKFAGGATLANAPLTNVQADGLTMAIARGAAGYREGGSVQTAAIDWLAVDAEARKILSPEQFELFVQTDLSQRYALVKQAAIQAAFEETWKWSKAGSGAGVR